MKITILYLHILIGAVLGLAIVRPPTDTTGTIGGTAHFVCEVDFGEHIPALNWLFNDLKIYAYIDSAVDYPVGTNKYVVSNSPTIFTLEVRNLSYADGGNYICEVIEVISQKKSAALIVLGSPVITHEPSNFWEGTLATYKCKANLGGPSIDTILPDQQPQLELFLDDRFLQAKSNTTNANSIEKVYEILLDDNMDKKILKCEIGTTKSKLNPKSSTLVKVLYSVRNITYSPKEDKYEVGSNITCSARGNPIPLFEWRSEKYTIIKGQLLNIADDMEGTNSWTCTARNSFGGRMYEDEVTAKFEAASDMFGNILPDEVDLSPVYFLIAVGCLVGGILGFTAYKRFKGVISKFKDSNATASFYVTTTVTVFGSSFQHGWNTGVLNMPQLFIKKFINESFTDHYRFKPSSGQLELLWAVCVSVYLLSGCFGVFIARTLADKFERKRALLFCHPFGIIAAALFGFCKMAHSFEMLIVGRLYIGFGCGVGSRLVLLFLTEIAPEKIQNEILVVHQFGITFGIFLSQVAGLHHCFGTESWWPYLLSLTAFPSVASIIILPWFPKSPVDHLMKYKNEHKEEEAGTDSSSAQLTDAHLKKAKHAFETYQGKYESKGKPYFEKYYTNFKELKIIPVRELFQSKWKYLSPCLVLLCSLNICQQLSGINVVLYYSLDIFKATGVPQDIIEYSVLSTGVIYVLMTGVSMMGDFKHKHMLLIGMLIMIISSLLITLSLHLEIFYISLLSINTFVMGFALHLGSITTYIGVYLFPSGLRTPAITIATTCNWVTNFCVALVYPVLHLKAGIDPFWIFTSLLVISIIYFYVKLPETKGKTMEEIHEELRVDKQPEEVPLLEIDGQQQIPKTIMMKDAATNTD